MKIHIWNCSSIWPNKVNFIDTNNVILGYDLDQSCCETAFWAISDRKDGSRPIHHGDGRSSFEAELDGYCFDPDFCERESAGEDGEDGGAAVFKLTFAKYGASRPDLFLRLENQHNGYYCHGFTFRGAVIINDSL